MCLAKSHKATPEGDQAPDLSISSLTHKLAGYCIPQSISYNAVHQRDFSIPTRRAMCGHLTHLSLASLLWDMGKQHSPRCDTAECGVPSESAKYSKHLINRVLHGAPITEVIFLREEKPVLALLMLSAKQGSHWYHF